MRPRRVTPTTSDRRGTLANIRRECELATLIHFHYHIAHVDTPYLGIVKGDRLCHVFSDLPDFDDAERELREWATENGPRDLHLQRRGRHTQHFDVWGPWLAKCGPPTMRATLRAWIRAST